MTITALPTPAPSRSQSQGVFDAATDAFVGALPNLVTEINNLIPTLNNPGQMANSTTSVAIGTGSKSFTIDTGKTFVAGQSIFVQYTTTPTNWMYGTVTSYNSATGALVVNVTSVLGSGTYALWTVSLGDALVSARGFSMSGAINTARGSVAMHATTMDLWSQPNIIDGTGSAVTITAIVNAPQPGAKRVLYPIAGTVITHGATFSVDGNASYTTAAGDALLFEAITTSTYNVNVIKQDGLPVSLPLASSAEVSAGTVTSKAIDPATLRASAIVLGTPVATTSGTAVDYGGIPAWVKRIIVEFSGVSVSGTSNLLVQIGDSGGIENTGYLGASSSCVNASSIVGTNFTTGFGISQTGAANVVHGTMMLTRLNSSTNNWAASHSLGYSNVNGSIVGGGSKPLSAPLDRVRITTVNGTDTFDAGEVNVIYE